MIVIAHAGYYGITLEGENFQNNELNDLEVKAIEGDILLHNNNPPYNHPTGKKLIVKLNKNQSKTVTARRFPENAGWEEIRKILFEISPKAYEKIMYSDPVCSEPPETFCDMCINSYLILSQNK